MRGNRVIISTLVLALLASLLLLSWLALSSKNKRSFVMTSDGATIRIIDYRYEPGNVRYEVFGDKWIDRMGKLLPAPARKKLGLEPAIYGFTSPTNEPRLSILFSFTPPASTQPVTSPFGSTGRLIVADEDGNIYDGGVHDANMEGSWVAGVNPFPRRGKELRLRLADGTNIHPELTIPNPDPGPHPRWVPNPLPATATEGAVQINLVQFRALQPGLASFSQRGLFPKTEAVFEVFEHGEETLNWRFISIEISDATGNRWRQRSRNWESIEGTAIRCFFAGALWPGEDAWKLKAEFQKVNGFSENELARIEGIPIPNSMDVLQPPIKTEMDGFPIEILAVIGENVSRGQVSHWNPDKQLGAITVLIDGKILAKGGGLEFVRAWDDQGRELKLTRPLGQAVQFGLNRFVPYSLNFQPGAEARTISLEMGVTQFRTFEFIAKPEQVLLETESAARF